MIIAILVMLVCAFAVLFSRLLTTAAIEEIEKEEKDVSLRNIFINQNYDADADCNP